MVQGASFSLKGLSVTTGESNLKFGTRMRGILQNVKLNDRRKKECDSLKKSVAVSVEH